ncbi:SRPBCC family protein [Phycicoccus sp. BSK3Z-2]|uniref:SRPBCC family protein n=1 Tax=Phycicoccus avicenniae TaxID=2828860 RepID=A0A941DB46_9MICO|nr:SRPBCC family protein [Phycicoccus avicenniae]MBR7743747.1 SRPBCC family protein [Phycicoccus avicenniae]
MSSTGGQDAASTKTADREVVVSRLVAARREAVFEAFTAVRHLSRWWGPDGFTTTTAAFEFRVGGVWEFVMHGPDGTDYPEWIRWTAIDPPSRIAMLHGERADDPDAFESVLTFEEVGDSTQVELHTVFTTKALRDRAVDQFGAVEGGRQTLGNLADYVTGMADEGAG